MNSNDHNLSSSIVSPQGIVRGQRLDILEEARICFDAMADYRTRRARSRNYMRGKPNETMIDPDTLETVLEDDYVRAQGRTPIKVNRIGSMMRNLKGQFRQTKTSQMAYGVNRDDTDASDMMTEALNCATRINQTVETDTEVVEESFIGGMYGWKTGYKWNPILKREEISIDPIDATRFFYNQDISTRRLTGLRIIGEIHDIPLEEVIMRFAKSRADEKFIRDAYADVQQAAQYPYDYLNYGFSIKDSIDFFTSQNWNLARVVEVWRQEYRWRTFVHDPLTGSYDEIDVSQEEIDMINNQRQMEAMLLQQSPPQKITIRQQYDAVWRCYYLNPLGLVLYESDTPYWHESHPYIVGLAQFIDGEVWGLIEDIIDQQRLSNKMLASIDFMFGAGAKGVLLIPQDMIPDGMTPKMFASEWTKFNGVIAYKPSNNPNAKAEQITSNSIPAGFINWMNYLSNEMKEISGVTGAQMGLEPQSGTPATMYNAQIMQGQLSTRDFFDSFTESRRQRDLKVIKLIAQYYDEPRMLAVSGRRADGQKLLQYDPLRVRELDFDITVSDTPDTPAARQLSEQFLQDLLNNNRLTVRQYLQLSSHPKADLILKVIDSTNPLIGDKPMSPQDVAALQMQAQAGNPDSIAMLNQAA